MQALENNKSPEFDKVIGYVLSMLFGLVFKDILSEFKSITDALNRYPSGPMGYEISVLATLVYCANTFRMLHGYIISLYDVKRNPTAFGPYPYSFKELFVLVMTFIVPLISASSFKKSYHHDITVFFLYQLPSLTYIIWDFALLNQLNDVSFEKDKSKLEKAKKYKKFVYVWIGLDLTSIILLIAICILMASLNHSIYYNWVLFLFTLVHSGIIFVDYVWKNNEFYFSTSS